MSTQSSSSAECKGVQSACNPQKISGMSTTKLVFVKHSSTEKEVPFCGDNSLLWEKLDATGVEYDIQLWDDPNVDWSKYSHIINTYQINYINYAEDFLKWLSNMEFLKQMHGFKMWNSLPVLRWNFNKSYLLSFKSEKIKIPFTIWLDKDKHFDKELISKEITSALQQVGKPVKQVVVKNVVGAGGEGVWRCKVMEAKINSQDLEKIYNQLFSQEGSYGVMVQEFVPKILSEGEWSLVYFNKVFSHAIIKKQRKRKYVNVISSNENDEFRIHNMYGGYFQIVPKQDIPSEYLSFGDCVVKEVSTDLLYARVDFVLSDENEPLLMEFEALDPILYLTEASYAETYVKTILKMCFI